MHGLTLQHEKNETTDDLWSGTTRPVQPYSYRLEASVYRSNYTSECGWRGVQSLGQALSLRALATSSAILPMISRGFWLFEGTESRYKGIIPDPLGIDDGNGDFPGL